VCSTHHVVITMYFIATDTLFSPTFASCVSGTVGVYPTHMMMKLVTEIALSLTVHMYRMYVLLINDSTDV